MAHDDHQAVLYDLDQFRTRAWHYVKKSGDDLDKPEDLEAIIELFKSREPT